MTCLTATRSGLGRRLVSKVACASLLAIAGAACTAPSAPQPLASESAYTAIAEASAQAKAVLRVANDASEDELSRAVGAPVANNIVTVRLGDDGRPGTRDDTRFASLAQLDAVPLVTPAVLDALLTFAVARGLIGADDPDESGRCSERVRAGAAAWDAYYARYYAGRERAGSTHRLMGVVFDNRPAGFVLQIRGTQRRSSGETMYEQTFFVAVTPGGQALRQFFDPREPSEMYGVGLNGTEDLTAIRHLKNGDALLSHTGVADMYRRTTVAIMKADGSVVEHAVPWDAVGEVEELADGNLRLRQGNVAYGMNDYGDAPNEVGVQTIDRAGKLVAQAREPATPNDWDAISPERICGF